MSAFVNNPSKEERIESLDRTISGYEMGCL